MIIYIALAFALIVVALKTSSETLKKIALCGAALIGVAIALKVFVHAITWAAGALVSIALISTLVYFLIRKEK
jgi:heme/copper-type cytochrome/quinol oxidase subunit 4